MIGSVGLLGSFARRLIGSGGGSPSGASLRITESGDVRVTHDGNRRAMENSITGIGAWAIGYDFEVM